MTAKYQPGPAIKTECKAREANKIARFVLAHNPLVAGLEFMRFCFRDT